MNQPRISKYIHKLRVEFDEVDSYGIVHHSRLITYLEKARVRYFISRGINLKKLPYNFVVYKIESRFIKPAFFLDELEVETAISKIADSYITFSQRIVRENETILKAKVINAVMTANSSEVLMIPIELEQILI